MMLMATERGKDWVFLGIIIEHLFKGVAPLSPPHLWGPLFPNGTKFCHEIPETLGYHLVKTRSLYLTWSWIGTRS